MSIFASNRSILNFTATSFLTLLLCICWAGEIKAQHSNTAGVTPSLLTPGTPAGTYPLEGFDTVNLFNGNMNFSLPILTIKGRGNVSHTINLRIEQRWQIDGYSAAFGVYVPMAHWWTGIEPGYGPGTMEGRQLNEACGDMFYAGYQMTRLHFTAPDGTEIEFRDQESRGEAKNGNCYPHGIYNNPFNRKKIFNAVDGSAATFISDTDIYDWTGAGEQYIFPTGNLMWRDGTMYRIVNGKVMWMRDRNGNRLEFTYSGDDVATIKDSLNRQVTITTHNQGASYYDQINFIGSGGTPRQIKIWYKRLEEVLRDDFRVGNPPYTKTLSQLFGMGGGQTVHNPFRAASVELPDGRSYQFLYNLYGELARVVLPTGGAYEYEWSGYVTGNPDIVRRVSEKRVYPNGGQGSSYSVRTIFSDNQTPSDPNNSWFITEQRDPSNNLLAHSRHYHYYNSIFSTFMWTPFQNRPYDEGREHKTQSYNTSGSSPTSMLRELQQVWTASFWGAAPPSDTRVIEKITTLADTSPTMVSKEVYTYGSYNNVTRVDEYGFGSGAAGSLARYRTTQYLTNTYDTNLNIHLRSLPTQEQVYEAGGALRAQTNYEYDNYGSTGNYAPLTLRSGISGLDAAFTTGYTTRGNVVKVSRWLSTGGTVDTYQQYDVAGNVVKAIDAKGAATILDYSDRFGSPDDDARQNTPPTNPNWLNGQTTFAFATKVTNALGHEAYTQYDYFLGAPVNSEDPNGIVSSVTYNDALDRPTQGIQARYKVGVGVTSARRQTTFTYDDTNRRITTTSDRDTFNDNILTGRAYYDGLGRMWRGASYEGNTGAGNTWSITDTQFDALGRVSQVSKPYRAADPNTASPPSGTWTTTSYDALSRVTTVQTPDTATVTTAYIGNVVTVTDQAGKQRRSLTDALGRLIRVDEPSGCNNCLGSVSSPTQPTEYLYDALDNLRKVTQGAQARFFTYDSLSRLLRARNPEQAVNAALNLTDPITGNSQWAMAYSYDNNGNLLTRVDARNVTTSYTYDNLNRNTAVSYNDGVTPGVNRYYDGAISNGKGRLHYSVSYNSHPLGGYAYSIAQINGYDAMGRVSSQQQGFLNSAGTQWYYYPVSRTYNLAGNVLTQTYPSTRTVSYGYAASGRLSSFSGNIGDGVTRTYADTFSYNAAGQMTKERFGTTTNLYHNLHYNNRLQLVENRLGTDPNSSTTWNRGALINYYSNQARTANDQWLNATDNNGNVTRVQHFVPTADVADPVNNYAVPMIDDYDYDALNRITLVTGRQQASSGSGWTSVYAQGYSYDRWGNRTINNGATWGTGINNALYTVDAATNRLTAMNGTGMTYDSAGNQTYDATGNRWFDGENRMHKATQGSTTSHYVYDADGKRVRRIIGSVEYWQVYGIEGELIAEYPVNGAASTPQKEYGYRSGQMLIVAEGSKAQWTLADHLGTPRMVVDKSGRLFDDTATTTYDERLVRHDYLPFGEELFVGMGNSSIRSAGMGYVIDAVRQKFGSKERDNETGMDYFLARYFSSTQGRFTRVDPYDPITTGQGMDAIDFYVLEPQGWNRYAYTYNNPLKFIDPDGKNPILSGLAGAAIGAVFGGGIEVAKQLITDGKVNDWQKVGAKALSGAIFGGVAGATLNVGLAGTIASGVGANIVGGAAERAVDGDSSTIALNAGDIFVDGITGGVGGYVGNKVLIYARDHLTYAARQGAYESWAAISGSPFKSLEQQYLKEALSHYAIEGGILGGLRTTINNGWTMRQVQTANVASTAVMTGVQPGMNVMRLQVEMYSRNRYSQEPNVLTPAEACRKYGGDACN